MALARFVPRWRRGRRGFLRGRQGTRRHGRASCVAGVGLGDIDRHFAWQAWHWWHWTGSGGALGSQMMPWTPRLFAWQARHSATWTCILRGRRGTWWHRPSLCVAGVALMALDWLWWRAWFPNDAVDAAALCMAGMALGDIDVHPAWQAWDLVTSTVTLRGRRGTDGTGLALVARLVPRWLGDIDVYPAWQAWDLVTSTFVSGGRRGTSGTSGTGLVLVARLSTHTLSTHNLSQPVHTTCRHTFVAHANPSPSLFSFPHFPSHLYLSFASYWKKLICGVIRSFNFFLVHVSVPTVLCGLASRLLARPLVLNMSQMFLVAYILAYPSYPILVDNTPLC